MDSIGYTPRSSDLSMIITLDRARGLDSGPPLKNNCATMLSKSSPLKLSQEVCMKRFIMAALVLSCAFAFTLGAQAQQAAPKEHSMTGCLKKGTEAGTYMVTDVEGSGPKSIGIVSSAVNLAPHV